MITPSRINTYLVTVKLPPNPAHDKNNKKIGLCPATGHFCTDITGQHHTFLFNSTSAKEAQRHWNEKGHHVTRVEQA